MFIQNLQIRPISVTRGNIIVSSQYGALEKVVRWITYGVTLSAVPFFVAATYEWFIGYDFCLFKPEYAPDFLLITFAVSTNVCGYSTDAEKHFPPKPKKIMSTVSAVTMAGCILVYSWYLSTKPQQITPDRSNIIIIVVCFVLVLNIFFGCLIESYPFSKRSRVKK